MREGQFRVSLSPAYGGSYTKVSIHGFVPTVIPERDARHLVEKLAFWSGWPVRLALSVDTQSAGWCEVWTSTLMDIPDHHLQVRFRRRRDRGSEHG